MLKVKDRSHAAPAFQPIFFNFQIEGGLQIEPEALGQSKIPRQPEGSVCRDRAVAVHNLVDEARVYAYIVCQAILANAHRLEEFFQQHITRMYRREFLGHSVRR